LERERPHTSQAGRSSPLEQGEGSGMKRKRDDDTMSKLFDLSNFLLFYLMYF
jgi:hypothetical protein